MNDKQWWRAAGSRVWRFFSSLKLTLFVLISLAAVSIIGTVIEQNQPVEKYLNAYGEQWTRVIVGARVHDMFHSWWFISLLVALTSNIIVCTLERFPPKWKALLNHKPGKFDPRLIDNCSHHQSVTVPDGPASAAAKVLSALKRRKYNVMNVGANPCHIYAWKGIIGRFGSDVTHVSLLLILIGVIVGSFSGFKDFHVIYVGSSIGVQGADFNLRLDKFWIDYYESGQIKQYNSVLTVVENGKDVMTKQIWVNEPL
ncbi:MAG: cytochrome c biogenesis protein ResB, partial [Deltaproteobacteria bacterium]|nr:cytochrome c biogenesis protein ResB [Deltaproteobacteria bacterium]